MFKILDENCWAYRRKRCVSVYNGSQILVEKFGISWETANQIVQEWVWQRF